MNRSRFLFFLASVALLIPIVSGTLAGAVSSADSGDDSLYKYLSVFSEVLSLVRRTYVEETSLDSLFAGALDGSTDALDPLSTYIPAESTAEFAHALEVGEGHSGLSIIRERGIAYVLATIPGSPGASAGLRAGDVVAKIDGASTREMGLWQILSAFAGPVGTHLDLELLRRGQARNAQMVLAEFPWPAPSLEMRDEVPVIRVAHVDDATAPGVGKLLGQIAAGQSPKMILDLRGVSRGDPAAAYATADLFAKDGELGTLSDRDRVLSTFAGTDGVQWTGRLIVLIDRGTQGASEILATVLQQAAGAELVGERTFGHAGRLSLVGLSTGSQVYLTDAYYTGPDHKPLDIGLEPTVQVVDNGRELGDEAADPILQRALELLGEEAGQRDAA
jgi:carboxyl-terminal processing protease